MSEFDVDTVGEQTRIEIGGSIVDVVRNIGKRAIEFAGGSGYFRQGFLMSVRGVQFLIMGKARGLLMRCGS